MLKVHCDSAGLMAVAADKNLGYTEMARLAKMSPETLKLIFKGKSVLLQTANRLYNALDRDPRIKIWISASLQTVFASYGNEKYFFGDPYSNLENVRRAYNFFYNVIDSVKSVAKDTGNVAFGG